MAEEIDGMEEYHAMQALADEIELLKADNGELLRHLARKGKELTALKADNAALLQMLREWLEADAEAECPDIKDMTPKQRAAFACFMRAHDVVGRPRPGASVIAEMESLRATIRALAAVARAAATGGCDELDGPCGECLACNASRALSLPEIQRQLTGGANAE